MGKLSPSFREKGEEDFTLYNEGMITPSIRAINFGKITSEFLSST